MGSETDPAVAELRRLASLEPPTWCSAAAAVERFVIRTLRLAGSIGIGAVAFWLGSIAIDVLDEPFATLSPLGLIGGVLAAIAGLLAIGIAFRAGFGPKGFSRIEAAWRESQADTPQSKKRLLGYDA